MSATPASERLATRHTVQLAIATLAWVLTLAIARFGPELVWDGGVVPGWIAIGANLVAGAIWILVHIRYLRAVGELQRKVLLDASGLALGVGLVGGCALAAANSAGLIGIEVDLSLFIIMISVVYLVATAIGNLRYR